MRTAIYSFLILLLLGSIETPCNADTTPITGEVTVEFYVDAQGKPTDIRVVKSTSEEYAKKAVEAVKKWTLEKKYRNTKMTVPISFSEPKELELPQCGESKKNETSSK